MRFRALPSLTFPGADVREMQSPKGVGEGGPPELVVAFMGLFGPQGVLPAHYTSLVIERCHSRYNDRTLRDFLDLFNHRSISFFYRAWEKYRFPLAYEAARRRPAETARDTFSLALSCLVGLGTPGLTGRCAFDDEAVVYYGGLFSRLVPTAVSLERALADFFALSVEVEQFCGQWLYLSTGDQSCLPGGAHPLGQNHRLGENVIVGQRVWDVQSKFRIRLGPLGWERFLRLMPDGADLLRLTELVRLYAGPEFDFDVQPVLRAEDVPACRLGGAADPGALLGWNTWLQSRAREADATDAIFCLGNV